MPGRGATPAPASRWEPSEGSQGMGQDDLADRLAEQRRTYGNNRRFYKSRPWRDLRASVLDAAHHECAMCKEKSPAVYSRAVTVHHVMHVDEHPGLALSRTYVDEHGEEHDNLMPLCHECHDIVHGRWQGHVHDGTKDVTPERW